MLMDLQRDAVDLGIVVTDSDSALGFYRDLLGMTHEGDMPMPVGGGGTMHRLRCGDSLIKLVAFDDTPERGRGGRLEAATGFRYLTIHVANLAEVMDACERAGAPVVIPVTEIRAGVSIGMVHDPDGNVVEFVSAG